ncbi:MAG: CarD family transcriptional regulator [Lachnospiraceae bacterium]|nr:CarD family transcriptional regulator [Lachnospiraceae bacterium]
MFRPGELIVYGRTGVCRVEKVEEQDHRQYYCLQALYQNCRIHAPVNGKVLMRPVLTRSEADRLIDRIPSVIAEPVENHVLRELTNHYLASINTCDAAELLAMTMSIYAKKQQALKNKKKLGAIDERFLREGESLLFGELAVSLGIAPGEVPNYIRARVSERSGSRAGKQE